ncbi:MAG: O-antigen ligase family protein [Chloroflexota bacterium]|nr:MAG: O-antigen ligase family protein [Chloroflexota bacterium]
MRKIAFVLSLVLIFMIPWEGVIRFAGIGDSESTAVKFFGLGVSSIWVISVLIAGGFRKPGPFHVAVFLFVLWNAFSFYWSENMNRTINQVITWVQLLVFSYIIWDLYTSRNAVFAGLQAYVLGCYVAVGGAISSYFSGDAFYTYYERFTPGDTNPDGFGFILALGIPVAWYLASSIENVKYATMLKLINIAFIPLVIVGLALSGTRTALIASIPGMAFGFATLTRLRPWARIAIFIILIAALIIIIPELQSLRSFQRFGTIGTEITQGDLNNRVNNWKEGLSSFAAHPLLGVGSNMYRSVNSLGKVAHNSYISVLVELGVVGFALFAVILAIAIIQVWSLPKWDKLFWLTMLLVWAIGSLTLTWEHRKSTWLFLSLLIASTSLASQLQRDVQLEKKSQPPFSPIPLTKSSLHPPGEEINTSPGN